MISDGLGRDLNDLRRRAGYSYRELSRRTGSPVSTLNDALRGRRFPRLETVLAVARACGQHEGVWRQRWLDAEGAVLAARVRPAERAMVPAELPHEVRGFAGRAAELAQLSQFVAASDGHAPVILVIDGMAGVGKSALALHWAHRAAGRFPDGQLFLNLRGHHHNWPPMSADEALERLLRSFGAAPQRAQADAEDLARQYRSLVAGKRLLLVLDDAESAAQVRSLLPAGPGCAVIVTSRRRLTGLIARDGARRLMLDVFSRDDAYTMLELLLGGGRVGRELDAAAELARVCGYLPLALRVAAANLETGRRHDITGLVDELVADDGLASFGADEDEQSGVRIAFDLSYRSVDGRYRRLFRLLGLVPGPDIAAEAAAALAGVAVPVARRCLDALTAAHLVEAYQPGRYRLHDLLRRYAAERAAREERETERASALRRLLDWYVSHAEAAVHRVHPHSLRLPASTARPQVAPMDSTAGLAWLEAERANLTAVVQYAARSDAFGVAWELADMLRGFYNLRVYRHEWFTTAEAGLAAANRGGDLRAAAAMHHNLGLAHSRLGGNRQAEVHFSAAIDAYEALDHPAGRATVLVCRGGVRWQLGELARAAEDLCAALAIAQEHGLRACMGAALGDLGEVYRELGDLEQAIAQQERAIGIFRELAVPRGEALGLLAVGAGFRDLGQPDRALEYETRALAMFRAIGSRDGETYALQHLALTNVSAGHQAEAEEQAVRAVAYAEDIGDESLIVEAHYALAEVRRHQSRIGEAVGHLRTALRIARRAEYRSGQIKALVGLAACSVRQHRHRDARAYGRRAVMLSRASGYRLAESQALALLDTIS